VFGWLKAQDGLQEKDLVRWLQVVLIISCIKDPDGQMWLPNTQQIGLGLLIDFLVLKWLFGKA
jgi:hypothetical protein